MLEERPKLFSICIKSCGDIREIVEGPSAKTFLIMLILDHFSLRRNRLNICEMCDSGLFKMCNGAEYFSGEIFFKD